MKLSDGDLRQMYQRMTARSSDADCVGEETLMRVACGEAGRDERERVVAHLARCSDCAREYQIARGLRSLRGTGRTVSSRLLLPLAAMLALAAVGLGWMTVLQQRSERTIASLQQQLERRPNVVSRIVERPAPPPRPQIGMPIVDADAEPTRGEERSPLAIDLAEGVDLYTLILHLPAGWEGAVEVLVDEAPSLPATVVEGSVTLTLHRSVAGPGKHVVHVRSGSRQVDFPFVVREP